ncbi:hypothetical protein ASG17_01655 [Brevundimonas sp. Leaf363]|uniref:DUF4893 domain-containing protein n=1 Tax=Brevundimonas sp. Leaf363 TaxID=1736353 RepID=UPI0006F56E0C|nr:DUF4893 domain-containing protein [Brevundimonas sp. Leaf363]KQS57454.1 hypothetical protein ASG17_01655 [Brevundimonas sp. Leaf363]
MPRHALAFASLAVLATAACGDNRPNSPAEQSPAVSEPAQGVPGQSAPEASADPAPVPAPSAPTPGEQGGASDWRSVASPDDAARLGRLDQAWRLARAQAEDAGFSSQVEALGPLVDPNAGLPGRLQPPPGTYRCRTIKLGTMGEGAGGLAYVQYPAFRCSIELTPGGDLVLTKTTGSQRTRGLLYPHTDRQLVYVGAQAWGADEAGYPAYGQMPERDQIGVLERIGESRWRLVLPWPKQEAKLELMEIVR